jgi:hypothetical protein
LVSVNFTVKANCSLLRSPEITPQSLLPFPFPAFGLTITSHSLFPGLFIYTGFSNRGKDGNKSGKSELSLKKIIMIKILKAPFRACPEGSEGGFGSEINLVKNYRRIEQILNDSK